MNTTLISNYISAYKESFNKISHQEIYKWHAVRHFQDNWDINATDFAQNLYESLRTAKNLLDSGNYLPLSVLHRITQIAPKDIRHAFRELFNESLELESRYLSFRNEIKTLKSLHLEEENDYQDHRAVLVYLTLKYPNVYFFYKFQMFKKFSELIHYHYTPIKGNFSNVLEFQSLCEQLKPLLIEDNELLKMHHDRLDKNCYQDPAYNLLTQDFIYACVRHIPKIELEGELKWDWNVTEGVLNDLTINESEEELSGRKIDHHERQQRNSRIGKLGEHFVIKYETEKLKKAGISNLKRKIEHSSVIKGDGLGYDIESRDLNDNKIYIEVKSTTGGINSPFYITRNELLRSIKDSKRFKLYRVYDFDEKNQFGKIKVFSGSLEKLCVKPVNYYVKLTN